MQRFFIIGTAHLDNPDLFQALESALDDVRPDQLILEIADDAVRRGDLAHQKPEMVCAYRWAERRGTAVRGHEPGGPSRQMLERAVALHGAERVDANIASASLGALKLVDCRGAVTAASRHFMALAARRSGWFKSVTWMEEVARDIVGPDLPNADPAFGAIIGSIIHWIFRARA